MTDTEFLIELNNQKPCSRPEILVSKFVEKNRVMPPGTPIPGAIDMTLSPFAIEWMDNMSPYSPIQRQVIEKAAQISANIHRPYSICHQPTNCLKSGPQKDLNL